MTHVGKGEVEYRQEVRPLTPPSQAIPTFVAERGRLAILVLLAALPYLGILGNDFAYGYDDKVLILDSPYVRNFHHLRELFTSTLFSNMGAQAGIPYYRPVVKFGFLLCCQIFGPRPFGFHLCSLLLNFAVVMMLYRLAENLLEDRDAAFASAAVFALLPVHVEAVAWISSITDIEVTLFCLLTFWFFLRAATPDGGEEMSALASMSGSFALALLSKELAVTIPALATLYEHFYRSDRRDTKLSRKIFRYGPLWLLLMSYFFVRLQVIGVIGRSTGMHNLRAWKVGFSAMTLIGQYVGLLVLPLRLSAFHEFHPSSSLFDVPAVIGVCIVILSTWVLHVFRKSGRPASFGILWLFITLAPALNVRWMGAYVLGERFLYLPSVGFSIVAGWTAAAAWRTSANRTLRVRTILAGTACLLTALCALRISLRVLDWRDDIALFSTSLAAAPNDFRLHDALGAAYWLRGNWNGAEREWLTTLRLEPASTDPVSSLGVLYAQERRFDLAVPLLQKTVDLNPQDADAHLNLGGAYAEIGDLEHAEEQFRAAIALFPLNFNAHNLLGKLYFDSKRIPEAEQQFRQSLQCEPNLAAYDYLGYSYMQQGESDKAEETFKAAVRFNRADSHAHFNLGKIYISAGRKREAEEELKAALSSDPNNAEIRTALQKVRQ